MAQRSRRGVVAVLFSVLVGAPPACSSRGTWIEISSEAGPVDALTLTVLGRHGALVLDQRLPEGSQPLELPGRLRLEGGGRSERVRVLASGWRGGEVVAFAAGEIEVAPAADAELELFLTAPPPLDTDADRIPDEQDGCPASADPDQQDRDGDGVTDACNATACPGNVVANPGFEQGTSGWWSSGGTITRVADGHSGGFAAQACKEATASLKGYTVADQPDTVQGPEQGADYRLEAWVRAAAAPLQNLQPVLRELGASGDYVGQSRAVESTMSGEWQQVTATYTVQGTGSRALEIYFVSKDAPDGTCFALDDICLVRQN